WKRIKIKREREELERTVRDLPDITVLKALLSIEPDERVSRSNTITRVMMKISRDIHLTVGLSGDRIALGSPRSDLGRALHRISVAAGRRGVRR
ncbi:MAG: hypothetical protein QI197_05845, partial [Candidatus Korarchaeota archaeon]|nr:hypothetical protein [Candidatus Korarchaeota archaeon]